MAFAGGVADHQNTHGQETWETPADGIHRGAQGRNSFDEILFDEKERLNRTNLARFVFQQEIAVLEFRIERFLHDFVKAVVFAFPRESLFQASRFWRSPQGKNPGDANGNGMVWPVDMSVGSRTFNAQRPRPTIQL